MTVMASFITAYVTCPISLTLAVFSTEKNHDLIRTRKKFQKNLINFIRIMLVILFLLFLIFVGATGLLGLYCGLFFAFGTSCDYIMETYEQLKRDYERSLNNYGQLLLQQKRSTNRNFPFLPNIPRVPSLKQDWSSNLQQQQPEFYIDSCIAGIFCVEDQDMELVCRQMKKVVDLSIVLMIAVFLCMIGFFFILVSYGSNYAWVSSMRLQLENAESTASSDKP